MKGFGHERRPCSGRRFVPKWGGMTERPRQIPSKERQALIDSARVLPDLTAAIAARDEGAIWDALKQADAYLTGSGAGAFSKDTGPAGQEGTKIAIREFLSQCERVDLDENSSAASAIIYLGDGGFSRLSLRYEKDSGLKIGVTGNSTDEVKKHWRAITS